MQRLSDTFEATVLAARLGTCRTCKRPFTPTHDADAPGPTTRHPFIPSAVDPDLDEIERHRPVQAPYPGAPGFVLACCPVCDKARWTVRKVGEPYSCAVWAEAVAAGLVAEGSRGTSSVG